MEAYHIYEQYMFEDSLDNLIGLYNQTSSIRGTWEEWILGLKTTGNRGPRIIEV